MTQKEILIKERETLAPKTVKVGDYVSVIITVGKEKVIRKGILSWEKEPGVIDINSSLGKAVIGKEIGSDFVWDLLGNSFYGTIEQIGLEKNYEKQFR